MQDSYWVKRLGVDGAKARAEKISATLVQYHASKSPKQKEAFSRKMAAAGELGRQKIKELSEDPEWKAWWLGKSLRSEVSLVKCAESSRQYWNNLPQDVKEEFVRRTIHSGESRRKAVATIRKWWNEADEQERTERIRTFAKGLHRKPNKPETAVIKYLDQNFPGEWKYVGDGQVWMGNRCPDIINVNGKKVVVEVFGTYWHGRSVQAFDNVADRKTHYRKYGFDCIVIWENECYDYDVLKEKLGGYGKCLLQQKKQII